MLKKEDLLKLPKTRKPTEKRIRQAYEQAKRNRVAILSTAVAEVRGEKILCIDCRIDGTIFYRSFSDGKKIRKFDDAGNTGRKSFYNLCGRYAKYIVWNGKADEQRVLQFYNITENTTQSAGELLVLIEHGKIENGIFTAEHAGSAGGYTPEELAIDPPDGWKESCIKGGMRAKHILLKKRTSRTRMPSFASSSQMQICISSPEPRAVSCFQRGCRIRSATVPSIFS